MTEEAKLKIECLRDTTPNINHEIHMPADDATVSFREWVNTMLETIIK
jgi:hypothetical protein